MYTVYDFINNEIPAKRMTAGWKVELTKSGLIALTFTILNFDWRSLDFLGDDAWNMFLSSKSYMTMRSKLEMAKRKFNGRTYFDAYSLEELKALVKENRIDADIDKMVSKLIQRKSEKINYATTKDGCVCKSVS